MISAPPPPAGSTISIQSDGADLLVVVAYRRIGPRFFRVIILLGALTVCARYIWDQSQWLGTSPILTPILLTIALAFGLMALGSIYLNLRTPTSETLRLTPRGIRYDSGLPPELTWERNGRWSWRYLIPRRTKLDISRATLRTLRLRPTGKSNRLTLDVGPRPLDLASEATAIEREWLYEVIVDRYALAAGEAGRGAAEPGRVEPPHPLRRPTTRT